MNSEEMKARHAWWCDFGIDGDAGVKRANSGVVRGPREGKVQGEKTKTGHCVRKSGLEIGRRKS